MKYPSVKNIHNDYFVPLEEFLKEVDKKDIVKRNGNCRSEPPSVIPVEDAKRIVAIGDIHGDFNALLVALFKADVIDLKGYWIGGETIVVQVGDVLDKGGRGEPEGEFTDCKDDSEWRILLFMEYLHTKAVESGGGVFLLLGNHEIMNFSGDTRYTTAATLAYFGGVEGRREAFKRGGIIATKIACMTNTVMRIGNWVFAHAGITPEIMKHYSAIEDINSDVRSYILGNIEMDATASRDSRSYRVYKLIGDKDGVLWTRAYGRDVGDDTCKQVNDTITVITGNDNGGMVVGHTVQDGRIGEKCSGRLFQIDRGMSEGFAPRDTADQRVDILEIVDGIPSPNLLGISGLKRGLKHLGLSTSGTKDELETRLHAFFRGEKIYIFVYGSLLNEQSRMETIQRKISVIGNSDKLILSKKAGFGLDFCHRLKNHRGKMTALALYYTRKPEDIHGALIEVTDEELKLLDEREVGYLRTPLDWNNIKIDGKNVDNTFKKYALYTYYTDTPKNPDKEYPILDTYRKIVKIIKSPNL